MDTAIELLVRHLRIGTQPPEHTVVKAWSQPTVDDLIKRYG
jgi:hypothetical protein